jgi:hypothetical protein
MKSLKKIIESVSYEENKIHAARKSIKELIDLVKFRRITNMRAGAALQIDTDEVLTKLQKIYNSLEI